MPTILRSTARHLLVLLAFLALTQRAQSTPLLVLTPTLATISALPGASVTFTGDIVNRTNADLASDDLFLNFSNFDPDALTTLQELGLAEFHIPSFSFKTDIALFSVDIAATSLPGLHTLDVVLQDVQGDFSDVITFAVNVQQLTTVPEPATLTLILGGIPMLIRRHLHSANRGGHNGYRS